MNATDSHRNTYEHGGRVVFADEYKGTRCKRRASCWFRVESPRRGSRLKTKGLLSPIFPRVLLIGPFGNTTHRFLRATPTIRIRHP